MEAISKLFHTSSAAGDSQGRIIVTEDREALEGVVQRPDDGAQLDFMNAQEIQGLMIEVSSDNSGQRAYR